MFDQQSMTELERLTIIRDALEKRIAFSMSRANYHRPKAINGDRWAIAFHDGAVARMTELTQMLLPISKRIKELSAAEATNQSKEADNHE